MVQKCLLETKDLTKEYSGRKAVDKLNIKVYKSDVYGFLGYNGAGKSTTIKSILGLVKPTSGKIFINGYDAIRYREKAISQIGAMVEAPSFYEGLTGYRNLLLIANIYGLPEKRVHEVLDMVGMTNAASKKVAHYSMGMKERLGIARAFLNNPSLVILDEPTNGLDPQGIIEIRKLIQHLSENYNVSFIISSHILSEIQAVCNRIGIIDKGRLLVQGSMDELLNTDEEIIEIYTREKEKTCHLISSMKLNCTIENFEKGIKVKIQKGNFQNINKLLVSNNVDVDNIFRKETSLEDYFLDITKVDKKYE